MKHLSIQKMDYLRLTHIVGGSFMKDFGKNATRDYTDVIPYKDSYNGWVQTCKSTMSSRKATKR